jgi:F-type H+-transporting ATPase subunit epsilon
MFRLSIVTPLSPYYEGDCRSMILPGSEGYLGVLSGHAPLLTSLSPGQLSVTESETSRERLFAVSGGFFEVSHNHAMLLTEAIEEPGAIDVERAREALERARRRLEEHQTGTDLVRAHRALVRAKNRLEIAKLRVS